jgi:hypothetical protein
MSKAFMHFSLSRTIVIGVGLLMVSWLLSSFVMQGQGPVEEYLDTQNSKFKIRVERRTDLIGPMHYWYVFRSAKNGDATWQEITRDLYGEPIPLPAKQIRFINNDIGYLFFSLKYAVTINAGGSWIVFDFAKNPFFKPKEFDYSKIADVEILPDGNGKLTMFKYDMSQGQSLKFVTKDYGQTWQVK